MFFISERTKLILEIVVPIIVSAIASAVTTLLFT